MIVRSTEIAAAVLLLIAGLSQIYAVPFWLAYYRRILATGTMGVRLHGLIGGGLGVVILVLHRVWHGAGTLLTLVGVLLVAEGIVCLITPRSGLSRLGNLDERMKARTLVFTGASLVVVAGVLAVSLLSTAG